MDVLVATVEGGRRDLIDGLVAVGANVTELEAYRMLPRSATDIRKEWKQARPDALILGSAATANTLIDAIGVDLIHDLRAVVPIGPTTANALGERGIRAEPPPQATYPAVIARLTSLRMTAWTK
jgi:uroporphyrinogen-III synthase